MCRKFAKFATILYFGNLIQELNVLAQFSPYLRDPLPLNSPKTEQSFRSRSSFPRNSFSSATSNTSCVSIANDSQDQYLKGQFKANYKTPTSPSHKSTYYQQYEANKSNHTNHKKIP